MRSFSAPQVKHLMNYAELFFELQCNTKLGSSFVKKKKLKHNQNQILVSTHF